MTQESMGRSTDLPEGLADDLGVARDWMGTLLDDIRAGMAPDIPMFQEPGHVVGRKAACYSPEKLYAVTRAFRTDVDPSDEDLWLTEESLETVHKNGITVHGQWFEHKELYAYTTGKKGTPRRELVIRYDKALLARGTLREVHVYERLPGGSYEKICRCGRPGDPANEMDYPTVLRARRDYVKMVKAVRNLNEDEFIALTSGTEIMKQGVEDKLARSRLQRSTQHAPVVATPIVFDHQPAASGEKASPIWDELSSAAAGVSGVESEPTTPVAEPVPEEPASNVKRGRGKRDAKDRVPAVPKPRVTAEHNAVPDLYVVAVRGEADGSPPASKPLSALDELLGGKTGFG